MSDWKRSTCEVSYEQFPAEIKAEIQKHIDLHNLGDLRSDVLMCIETHSEKAKKGILGSAQSVSQFVMVTPRWLMWVVKDKDGKSPAAFSALLNDVVIQDYAETPLVKMVPDTGIQVNGKLTDVSESVSAFLGLEENAAGRTFKELVIRVVQESKS